MVRSIENTVRRLDNAKEGLKYVKAYCNDSNNTHELRWNGQMVVSSARWDRARPGRTVWRRRQSDATCTRTCTATDGVYVSNLIKN
jgi:hypothetical protein